MNNLDFKSQIEEEKFIKILSSIGTFRGNLNHDLCQQARKDLLTILRSDKKLFVRLLLKANIIHVQDTSGTIETDDTIETDGTRLVDQIMNF